MASKKQTPVLLKTDIDYVVWRKQFGSSEWIKTAIEFSAKSDAYAHSRVGLMFKEARFHSMSLVAMRVGSDPNKSDAADTKKETDNA